jgi:hypothetical protein
MGRQFGDPVYWGFCFVATVVICLVCELIQRLSR